jgi:hypothetical protein
MRKLAASLLICLSLSACIGGGSDRRSAPVRQSTATLPARPETRQCLATLGATKANFTPLPDHYYGAGCTTLGTVRLASLRSDDAALALTNLGPVVCPLANTFAAWVRYGVDRAARQVLGSALVKIETMGSYNCRNVAGTSHRSAHARAEAIDVAAFVLADGRRISLSSQWGGGTAKERQFLKIVHDSACKRFGTVLGPAYNAAHKDHFHLELSGRSFCK